MDRRYGLAKVLGFYSFKAGDIVLMSWEEGD
jgi:hypothetical protein